jgi:hypothetical protein
LENVIRWSEREVRYCQCNFILSEPNSSDFDIISSE